MQNSLGVSHKCPASKAKGEVGIFCVETSMLNLFHVLFFSEKIYTRAWSGCILNYNKQLRNLFIFLLQKTFEHLLLSSKCTKQVGDFLHCSLNPIVDMYT